jgi:hypothetical protein
VVAEVAVGGFAEVAGPRMYRRNAFRLTGLPTDAGPRAVRQRRQRVMPALEAGADVDLGHRLPVGPGEVRAAFDLILGDPRRRLMDELFWLWDTPEAACGCPRTLHRDHDAAVTAHCAALDMELDSDGFTARQAEQAEQLWSEAARLWGRVLRRAAFWDHVRWRVTALDERQLDESVVGALRDGLPAALVRPLVELAAAKGESRLAERARAWPRAPRRAVDDQLEEAAGPLYDAVRAAVDQALGPLDEGRPEQAAAVVYERAVPELKRLEALVPHALHRRTAHVRNEAAVLLNNCATALIDRTGPAAAVNAREWLGTAGELATDPRTAEAIRRNGSTLDEIVKTFDSIRRRVAELVALGRHDLARSMLRDVRRQLKGAAGTAEIDRMLADLDRRRAPYGGGRRDAGLDAPLRRAGMTGLDEDEDELARALGLLGTGRPQPPYYGGHQGRAHRWSAWDDLLIVLEDLWERARKAVVPLLLIAALVAGAVWWRQHHGPGAHHRAATTAALFSEKIADNAPVGRCIATSAGWKGDKSAVPVVGCSRSHWGEVLGYVPLGAVPSRYPGTDQTFALTRFSCGLLLDEQGLATTYRTDFVYPGKSAWNTGGGRYENYATCVVHRADGTSLPRHRLTAPGRHRDDPSVRMDLYNPHIWNDPPVGACLADKHSVDASIHHVPAVDCDHRHWAEVMAYPVLYRHGGRWPGNNVVYAAAQKACLKIPLPKGYRMHITWPAKDWWKDDEARIYAVCAAARTDDRPYSGRLR